MTSFSSNPSRAETRSPAASPPSSSHLHQPYFPYPASSVKTQPNAHPYAIKTTSTALLSRSTSSSAQHANSVHRYVPASPTHSGASPGADDQEKAKNKPQRLSRHRYSRSLTSDSPLPLPPPPDSPQTSVSSHGQSHSYSLYFPSQAHHTRAFASEGEEDDTTRRTQRKSMYSQNSATQAPKTTSSLMFPSSAEMGLSSTLDLPDDPKTWTSEQLSIYLSASLGVKSFGHSHSTNANITAFVRDRNISGRTFMRLTEADLEEFTTPLTWRPALLSASQSLRQGILRGRIWGNDPNFLRSDTSDPHPSCEEPESDYPNMNNSPGTGGSGFAKRRNGTAVRVRKRSRNLSEASDSSDASDVSNGRVRDMVNELERSMDEEGSASLTTVDMNDNGRRSVSPVKNSRSRSSSMTFTSNQHHSAYAGHGYHQYNQPSQVQNPSQAQTPEQQRNVSPTKTMHYHRLPQRGTVNDLFSPSSPSLPPLPPSAQSQGKVEEDDETITKRINGAAVSTPIREPRLLPFPPSPFLLPQQNVGMSPMHTGAAYPLPSSPDHSADYELGFRPALNSSPHSQVYVIRHNPNPSHLSSSSPSSHGNGNGNGATPGGKPTRPLPYPPVLGEAILHHPRPRRLVGTPSASDGDQDKEQKTTTESYETAIEADNGIEADGESTSSEHSDGRASLSPSTSMRPSQKIPPSKAGEEQEEEPTIEELLASSSSSAPVPPLAYHETPNLNPISGAEAWEMELGETVKRIGAGVSPSANARSSLGFASSGTLEGVREIGRKAGRSGAGTTRSRRGLNSGSFRDGVAFTEEKEKERKGTRRGIMDLFADVVPEGSGEEPAQPMVVEESKNLEEDKDKELKAANAALVDREAQIASLERAMESRESLVIDREASVDQRAQEVEEIFSTKSTSLSNREDAIGLREKSVFEREAALDAREAVLNSRESSLEEQERTLREREQKIDDRESEVGKRELKVEEREEGIEDEKRKLVQQHEIAKIDLGEREAKLVDDSAVLEGRLAKHLEDEQIYSERVMQLEDRENLVVRREEDLTVREAELEELAKTRSDSRSNVNGTTTTTTTATNTDAELDIDDPDANTDISPSRANASRPYVIPTWAIKRDLFLGRFMGVFRSVSDPDDPQAVRGTVTGRYLVLMGIGVCAVVLKVLGKRVGGFLAGKAPVR